MGAQTSNSRHQVLSDAYPSIVSGLHQNDALTGGGQVSQDIAGAKASPFKVGNELQAETNDDNELIPCVFSWTHGGHNVFLTGSFNNWSLENKIKLVRSGHEFSVIQNLPRGVHYYKFIVDDEWRFATDQQVQYDDSGNTNNVLDIRNFLHHNFKIPTDVEMAKQSIYYQCIPEPAEYSTDAPTIPILLSKSNCIAGDFLQKSNVPLHCISNHVYHDAHALNVFGPHISVVAATERWRVDHYKMNGGQRYATYIYVTVNPLFPCPADSMHDFGVSNPLKHLIHCKIPERIIQRNTPSTYQSVNAHQEHTGGATSEPMKTSNMTTQHNAE